MAQTATPTKPKRAASKKRKQEAEVYPIPEMPPMNLPAEDEEPLESDWHLMQIHLLIDLISQLWEGRTDYFAGGNMFIYYSTRQAESVLQKKPLYKGPDFFVVKGVDGTKPRESWYVWAEDGRYPDVIFELSSPSTAKKDREDNIQLYSKTFGTPEYFIYDPYKDELLGYRLARGKTYEPIPPNEKGWLWSEQLGVYVAVVEGVYRNRKRRWVRWYTESGELVPTPYEAERQRAKQAQQEAEAERQRAEAERQRAEQLAQRLRELGVDPDTV